MSGNKHHIGILSPPPTKLDFTLYKIHTEIEKIGDMRSWERLGASDLTPEQLKQDQHDACQAIGAAAEWMGFGGLLVPSARREGGFNLVIFTKQQDPDFVFEVMDSLASHD